MSIRDFSATDHLHMAQALRLAEHGLYTCDPNPRVGCVVAHGERVIGSGAHLRAGEPHAEVHALREAGDAARGATAYVTLEPCAHHGRTPPCADALIAAGVARVVAACEDPYPKVAGAGLSRLRAAGVSVDAGLMAEAARELNRGFFARIERGRPWLRLKLAATLDGRTALRDGRSHWITGPAARADNMRWRARCSALLVGSGTALADDPKLTVRFEQPVAFKPPLRVVLDRLLRLPANAALLDGSSATLVVHDSTVAANDVRFAKVECLGVPARDQRLDLQVLMQALSERGVNELQVEAGPILSGALLQAGLVDEMLLYLDPSVLGDTARGMFELPAFASLTERPRWRIIDNRIVGESMRLVLRPASA